MLITDAKYILSKLKNNDRTEVTTRELDAVRNIRIFVKNIDDETITSTFEYLSSCREVSNINDYYYNNSSDYNESHYDMIQHWNKLVNYLEDKDYIINIVKISQTILMLAKNNPFTGTILNAIMLVFKFIFPPMVHGLAAFKAVEQNKSVSYHYILPLFYSKTTVNNVRV